MIIAHFDASGQTDDDTALLSVACYAATDSRWHRFDREWRRFLKTEKLEYFRMAEHAHSSRQFKGASEEKRLRCIKKAHAIIKTQTEKGLAATVDKKAFAEVIPARTFGTVFKFAVFTCLIGLAKWMEEAKLSGPVACVLDRGDRHGPEIEELKRRIKEYPRLVERFAGGEWRFSNKVDAPGIQAADTLAYEVNKFWRDPARVRLSLQKLFRGHTDQNKLWDSSELQTWGAQVEHGIKAYVGG
jgi:hypothetical protein